MVRFIRTFNEGCYHKALPGYFNLLYVATLTRGFIAVAITVLNRKWALRDLNSKPSRYERDTLTNCVKGPFVS